MQRISFIQKNLSVRIKMLFFSLYTFMKKRSDAPSLEHAEEWQHAMKSVLLLASILLWALARVPRIKI